MNQKEGFSRVLSRLDILTLAFGAMIGWGWVVLSNFWIESAGVIGSLIAFGIGAIMILFVGFTYAELTSAMPKTGGEHEFVYRAMGMRWSFVASWAIALGYISVVAFEAVALPTVLEYLTPNYKVGYMWSIAGWDVYASWALVGIVGSIFITWLNYIGVKPAAVFQLICTVLLGLVGISLIFGSAVTAGTANPAAPIVGSMSGIFSVMVMIPFLFVGFDVIPQAAEEIKVPFKQIGNMLIISVALAAVFYIGVTFSVGHVLSIEELKNTTLASADAMAAVFGSSLAAKILIIGGIGGILTSWNAFMIGGSRILYAMAESKMIPSWFAKLHPKYKTPHRAILFIGLLSVIAPLFGRKMLVWLVDAGGLNIVITYFLVALTFLILRKREPGMPRPFRAGKGNWIGYFALILSLFFGVLYLPGMPAALVWPYEWVIIGIWWIIGMVYLFRIPNAKHDSFVTELSKGNT